MSQAPQNDGERGGEGIGGREAQAANLFDLRRIIGGLFLLYGAILTVTGLGDSHAEIAKAAGVHINLIAGLGMLALGAFFVAWGLLRPLGRQLAEAEGEAEAEPRA
ncbi:MAG: hypothetical protein QOH30_1787 [Baekduia sp.]|jgi:hypothetical protein|nr:hypothetical protein [Conexibacter sp.]MDX6715229.1 hypothetical protein [Baekduia sp.]MDX6733892.1 hypothetical protein [Baekduia sp.]